MEPFGPVTLPWAFSKNTATRAMRSAPTMNPSQGVALLPSPFSFATYVSGSRVYEILRDFPLHERTRSFNSWFRVRRNSQDRTGHCSCIGRDGRGKGTMFASGEAFGSCRRPRTSTTSIIMERMPRASRWRRRTCSPTRAARCTTPTRQRCSGLRSIRARIPATSTRSGRCGVCSTSPPTAVVTTIRSCTTPRARPLKGTPNLPSLSAEWIGGADLPASLMTQFRETQHHG
jgi:hypothetical protein